MNVCLSQTAKTVLIKLKKLALRKVDQKISGSNANAIKTFVIMHFPELIKVVEKIHIQLKQFVKHFCTKRKFVKIYRS